MKTFALTLVALALAVSVASAKSSVTVFSGDSLAQAEAFLSFENEAAAERVDAVWISSPIVTAVHTYSTAGPTVMVSANERLKKTLVLRLGQYWMSIGRATQGSAVTLLLPADAYPTRTSFYHRVAESLSCYATISDVTVTIYRHQQSR